MRLAKIVLQKSLLQHPFYQLWLQGKLPPDVLQQYAGQYFQLVAHLPRFVSTLHSQCHDEGTRKILLQNLQEEELGLGNGNVAHTQLWLDFAEEIGLSREETVQAALLPATEKVLATIYEACQRSLGQGAAALYAYESQIPEIAKEKKAVLQTKYNITSAKALRFFEVHETADLKHGAVWHALALKSAVASNEKAAERTATALWNMFDAMYDEFVPEEVKMGCSLTNGT